MAEQDVIKAAFIQASLSDYGRKTVSRMRREIARLNAIDTSELEKSVSFKVYAGGADHQGKVEIIFKEYGRMVDMGVGAGYKNNRENRRDKITNRRKAKKIYSPIAYGLITPLINELQYGYTQAAIENIKQSLEK